MRAAPAGFPCDECAKACPVEAIGLLDRAVAVRPHCLGCGRCAAACPAGALGAEGFAVSARPRRVLEIECARVPAEALGHDAWAVRCLGGLTVAALLAAIEASGAEQAVLVDRGLCAGCACAGTGSFVQSTGERLAAGLGRVEPEAPPLSADRRPIYPQTARPAGAMPSASRRALLMGLLAVAPAEPQTWGTRADREALDRFARRRGAARPALAPRPVFDDRCLDLGICAKNCPTGALRREADEEGTLQTLLFEAERCIECGRCATVCPETALAIRSDAEETGSPPLVVRQKRLPVCPKCEEPFLPEREDDDALCPACRKETSLFHDLRRQQVETAPTQPSSESSL